MAEDDSNSAALAAQRMQLEQQHRSGAGWFFWIAGLSIVNSAVNAFGGSWGFIAGLGITQVIDALVAKVASGRLLGLMLDIGVALVFVAFGVMAQTRNGAYVAGMVVYALDGLLFLISSDWVGLGFHALVLWWISRGFVAARRLAELPSPAPSAGTALAHPAAVAPQPPPIDPGPTTPK